MQTHVDCAADCDEATFRGPVCPECQCCRGCAGAYRHQDGAPCPGCLLDPEIVPRPELRKWGDAEKRAMRVLLGNRVAACRKILGLSQRGMAAKLGQSPSWVRECERGAQWSPWWLVLALSEASGIHVGWFVGKDPMHDRRVIG